MMASCLNVETRTTFLDYRTKGDCGEKFYEVMRANPEWRGITELVNTVLPTVLILENNLFVTGIPTRRKDKVGTPIRWSFHLRREDAGKWFAPLAQAFRNGSISQLGDKLDKLCGITQQNDNFTPPDVEDFLKILENLPGPTLENNTGFRLWTSFMPTDETEIQKLIDELPMPEGEITISIKGKDKVFKKKRLLAKKKKKLPVFFWGGVGIFLILISAIMGYVLALDREEMPILHQTSIQETTPERRNQEFQEILETYPLINQVLESLPKTPL